MVKKDKQGNKPSLGSHGSKLFVCASTSFEFIEFHGLVARVIWRSKESKKLGGNIVLNLAMGGDKDLLSAINFYEASDLGQFYLQATFLDLLLELHQTFFDSLRRTG